MLKKLILSIFVVTMFGVSLVLYSPIVNAGLFDNAKNQACSGVALDASSQCDPKSADKLSDTISNIIDILSIIVGIVAVILIIINGLKFILSGGDSNKVNSAKNGIIYAVVGLIFVALAQLIVKYVIIKVGG